MSNEVRKILREMWACDHFTGKQAELLEALIDAKLSELCSEKHNWRYPDGNHGGTMKICANCRLLRKAG